jgi:hypothetical protein
MLVGDKVRYIDRLIGTPLEKSLAAVGYDRSKYPIHNEIYEIEEVHYFNDTHFNGDTFCVRLKNGELFFHCSYFELIQE